MSSVDNRVVNLEFNNNGFEAKIASTLRVLEMLKKGLNLNGAARGLDEVSNAGRRFSLAGMGAGIDSMRAKFSALQVVGVTALATLTHQALASGTALAKSFTIQPIMDGMREYETNLNSIQTILANTQASGATLRDVEGALQNLNTYSDKTIYNFSEMARNIGTFTAAGVDLETSTSSIKGIANLAALSGSNSQQASTAMYQLSQAISSGRVSLQDWNSVVNAGMGGTVFQRALAQTAEKMGTLDKGAVKLSGKMKNATINGKSFRESITAKPGEESWLTSEVLTATLGQFTGDLSDADLAAQGFSKSQIAAIQAQAKTATQAATQVKTASQLIGTLQEAAGSGWAKTWQLIFGDFEEAKSLFTGVSNVLGGFVTANADARNKVLSDWKVLGGRTALIKGIGNVFTALMSVIKPIGQAFRDIFPAMTGQRLFELTTKFRDFTAGLKIGGETAANLRRTFAGVFAIFSILGQVLGGAARLVGRFFGALSGGSGGLLNFTGGVGDFLVSLDKMLKRSGAVTKFFDGLGDLVSKPLSGLKKLGGLLADAFSGFKLPDLSGAGGIFSSLMEGAGKALSFITESMTSIGSAIVDAFANMDFSKVFSVINTGLLAGIVLLIRKFISGGGFSLNIGGGIFDSIKDGFDQLTGALSTMQANVKADIILKIAGALAILAGAMLILSTIDVADMGKALAGVAGAFGILQGAMIALNTAIGVMGTLKLPALAVSLLAIAGAMLIMAGAIKLMATMSWEEIGKGLAGIGGSLLVIAGAMTLMPKNMLGQALAIGILALALTALAGAVAIFGTMDLGTIGTGLLGIAGSLLVIAGAMTLMPANMLLQAAGLVAVGAALNLIAMAMNLMGGMSWEEIAKGLVALGGSLLILAGGLYLMTGALPGAAALIVAAGAIAILTPALLAFSLLSWEAIGKAMVVLGGSLLIMAGGLYLMTGTVLGSAALVIAAAALNLLVPVLVALGAMSWEAIAKGMVALAGAFTVLGIAGLLLAPLSPIIMALSVAVLLIGAGFALAGVGALALATAFGILVGAVAAGVGVIKSVLSTLAQVIVTALTALATGIVKGAQILASNAGRFASSMATIIGAVLRAVSANIPRVAALFLQFINAALRVLVSAVPRIASAGLTIMVRLMAAISARIPALVTLASSMMVRFLNALAGQMPRITQAGANLIVAFLNGLARQVPRIATAATNLIVAFLRAIGANMGRITAEGTSLARQFISGVVRGLAGAAGSLAGAAAGVGRNIASGMARGVASGIGSVIGAAKRMASSALSAAKGALGIHSPSREFAKLGSYSAQGYAKGLDGSKDQINAASTTMRDLLKTAMAESKKDIEAAEKRLKSLRKARHKDKDAIRAQTKALAQARSENKKATAAYKTYGSFADEMKRLNILATQAEGVQKRLDDARKKYADAVKARNDFSQSIRDQLVGHIDVDKDTQFPDFIADMQKKVIETQQFSSKIQQLKSMGLNNYFYKELLAKGTDALPFMDQILAKGKNGVDEMNVLGSALDKASRGVGDTAAKNLYQAGVDAAAGLVKGLEKQQKNIEAQMDRIATYMVKSIKKKLGIRSPSREFAKIGDWSVQGLVRGLLDSSSATEKAAGSVGRDAIFALQKSLSGMSTVLDAGMDLNPTITPVLDLSDIRRSAATVGSLLPAQQLAVGASYSGATSASRGYNANADTLQDTAMGGSAGTNISFTQINNSPKPISSAEVYRQTRNQLSVARGKLPTGKGA